MENDKNRREFTVIFSDKSRKTFLGDSVVYIYVNALRFILGLNKSYFVVAIIDDSDAKLYTDFDWDITYSEKETDYLVAQSAIYTNSDIERAVLSYVRFIGANIDLAQIWINNQQF